MKSISAVIPTYNGSTLLEKNLPAVMNCLRPGDELLIVDDASTDDTVHWLQEECTVKKDVQFHIVVNQKNLRFGASVNRGVQAAQHDYILLLNNDVSPHPDILEHLLSHFTNETVFAVGCAEQEPNGVRGGRNTLWFDRGLFQHSRADDFSAGSTAWASGGSALFDKAKWLELGGFDRVYYPAYWEDIDLSFRARQRGWKVLFEPKAVVDHNHETTNQDVFGQRSIESISWRNAYRFVWKNGTVWQKIANLVWRPYWWWKRATL